MNFDLVDYENFTKNTFNSFDNDSNKLNLKVEDFMLAIHFGLSYSFLFYYVNKSIL